MVASSHDDMGRIVDGGVVAVMRGADADTAIEVADALRTGGVTAIELTADTPGVMDLVRDVSASFDADEAIIGAGTVLDAETARAALLSGAEFVVAPNLNEEVIEICNRYGRLVAPGVLTPTEAVDAYQAGADMVKVFPASSVGPGHVKGLSGPLGQIPIMPTGGVDLDNVADFVAAGAVAVGVGSALVDEEAIAAGDFDALTETARAFSSEVERARADDE